MARRFCWRLGVRSRGQEADSALIAEAERAMRTAGTGPDAFFFAHRGGRAAQGDLAQALAGYEPVASDHPYWQGAAPQSMLIEEVEEIWAAIAERDDWAPLEAKVDALREMGRAHGEPPAPAGHLRAI